MSHARSLAAALALGCTAVLMSAAANPAAAAILPAVGGTAQAGVDTPLTGFQPGAAASAAGDVDGDGKDDLVIGSYPAKVLLGSASTAPVDAATAGGRTWSLSDPWSDPQSQKYPVRLTPIGDVNADGRDDLFARPDENGRDLRPWQPGALLGVIAAGRAGAGATTTDLGSPTAVYTRLVSSTAARTRFDDPVAIGDHDGDGFDDFLVNWGAEGVAASGLTVIYGGPGLAGTVDLADPAERGYRVYATPPTSVPPGGGSPSDYTFFRSTTGVGDINGDGLDDFALQRMVLGGKSYTWFVFGNRSRTRGDLDLDQRAGRASRVGPVELGTSIVPLGDLNGDRLADVAVSQNGSTSVVLRGQPLIADMGISTTFQKINWRLNPQGAPGDVNGDGIPDVAAYAVDQNTSRSMSLVLFGPKDGKAITVPYLGTPTTAAVRFPQTWESVATVGDVNGDGLTDLRSTDGLIYGYREGTAPVPDSTPPTFALRVTSSFYVGTCGFFGQKRVTPAEAQIDLSEVANVELVAVQNGVTRRATVPVSAGQNLYAALPKSLIAPSLGSVAVTATALDAAGNRSAAQSATVAIANGGYRFLC